MAKPNKYEKEYYQRLVGQTITDITWDDYDGQAVPVLLFNSVAADASLHAAAVLADPEGNGPGFLHHNIK